MRAIGPAEAGACLYANALNALAHANHRLHAVARIAEHVPCFSDGLRHRAAIANAVVDATGVQLRSPPFTPYKVGAALAPGSART